MFQTLDNISVAGKRVLVRADLNVPMQNGVVSDETRLSRLCPTLIELADKGAKVIILSHFGRPKKGPVAEFSLAPVAHALGTLLERPVGFAADCIGDVATSAVANMRDGDIVVLENVRFHAGEEANDPAFAAALAQLGDIYVNDAFSCAHRAHASTTALAHLLPSAAGRLMQAELQALDKALENPTKPVIAVVGGAKISTKLELLENLVKRVDFLALGGGMANTFLAAQGHDLGKSLCEQEMLEQARTIMATAEAHECTIILPVDGVAAIEFSALSPYRIASNDDIHADEMILDMGPASVKQLCEAIAECKTLVWNGPLGAFELVPFASGTVMVAEFVRAQTQHAGLCSVAGGGDTVAALALARVVDDFSYVSSAGGAFLEWLEGKTLPGVAALG